MNNDRRFLNITNEQELLIEILNNMYHDNLRQITNLNESNIQIRNLIIQILNNNLHSPNIERHTTRNRNRNTSNRNLDRINFNNMQFTDSIIEDNNIPFNHNSRRLNSRSNSNNFTTIIESFLEPVEVFPTQVQIETATRNVRYCDIVSPTNTSCPISLTNFNDNDMVTVIRHCSHIFNTNELNTWFRNHYNCPVCRFDIRDDNSNVSSMFDSQNQINDSNENNIPLVTSNVERSSSYIINNLLESIVNEYGLHNLISYSNYIDNSGNTYPLDLLQLFTQINNRRK
jgi:hypothetical protein